MSTITLNDKVLHNEGHDHIYGKAREGIIPGLAGGVLMAFALCALAFFRGLPFYQPLQVMSAAVLGSGATHGIVLPIFIGLMVHFSFSAALGMMFVTVVGSDSRHHLLGLGAAYGIVLWAMMQFVILPIMYPGMAAQLGTVWTFFLGHLGYGLMLAACVPTRRDIGEPEPEPDEDEQQAA